MYNATAKPNTKIIRILSEYRKSSINPPPRGLLVSTPFEGGGALTETGGLFNLEQTMISVPHKELEYKVEKLKYKKLEVTQPRIRIKSELPGGK